MSFRSIPILLFALFLCFSVITISATKNYSPYASNSVSKCNPNGEKTRAKGIPFHGKTLEGDEQPKEESAEEEDSLSNQDELHRTKSKWSDKKEEIEDLLVDIENVKSDVDSLDTQNLKYIMEEKEEALRDGNDIIDTKPYLEKVTQMADKASAEAQVAKKKVDEAIASANKVLKMIAEIETKLDEADENDLNDEEKKKAAIHEAEKDGITYEKDKEKVQLLLQEAETAYNEVDKLYDSITIASLQSSAIVSSHNTKKELEKAINYQLVAHEQKNNITSLLKEVEDIFNKAPAGAKNALTLLMDTVKEKRQSVERDIGTIASLLVTIQEAEAKGTVALADIDNKANVTDAVTLSNDLVEFLATAEVNTETIESNLNSIQDDVNEATKARHQATATVHLHQTDLFLQSATDIVQQLTQIIKVKEDAVAALKSKVNVALKDAKEELLFQLQNEESALATAVKQNEMAKKSVQSLHENKKSVENALKSIKSAKKEQLPEMQNFVKEAQSSAENAEKELQKLNEDLRKVKVDVEKTIQIPKPSDHKGETKVLPSLPKTQSNKTMDKTLQSGTSQNAKPKENETEMTKSTPLLNPKKQEIKKEIENKTKIQSENKEGTVKPDIQTVALNKTKSLSAQTTNQNITETMKENAKTSSVPSTFDGTATHFTSVWIISTLSVIIFFLHSF